MHAKYWCVSPILVGCSLWCVVEVKFRLSDFFCKTFFNKISASQFTEANRRTWLSKWISNLSRFSYFHKAIEIHDLFFGSFLSRKNSYNVRGLLTATETLVLYFHTTNVFCRTGYKTTINWSLLYLHQYFCNVYIHQVYLHMYRFMDCSPLPIIRDEILYTCVNMLVL